MVVDEGCFEGVEVRDVVRLDSSDVVSKVEARVRRGCFFSCPFSVCFVVLLHLLYLHQILGDDRAN